METSTHIQICLVCHRICTDSLPHLPRGGAGQGHDEQAHLAALLDCAQNCVTCADFRGSSQHEHVCSGCAEICEGCAVLCEKHADPEGAFKPCVASCREMGGHH